MKRPSLRWIAPLLVMGLTGCAGEVAEDDEEERDLGAAESDFTTGQNCADPSVLKDGDRYVLTCTGFRIFTSTDLHDWKPRGRIFPDGDKPAWTSGNNWAAEIHPVAGGYAAYYTAKCGNFNCIGAAFNTQAIPDGAHPYKDLGKPLIANGGVSKIDPHMFVDGDDRYLYWKAETGRGDAGYDTIWGAKLSPDGRQFVTKPQKLMTAAGGWEGRVVEGPAMMKANGFYYLFYSGNNFATEKYAVGVARAKGPLGNFDDNRLGHPIVDSGKNWVGPGHNSFAVAPDGQLHMVYHAFSKGGTASNRKLMITPMSFNKDDWPVVRAAL